MSSDFFLEEADQWRDEAWDYIRRRPDVTFSLLTKRAHRIKECLPSNWGRMGTCTFCSIGSKSKKT